MSINKRKIINDPVYGFINIQNDLIFDLIEHPYFQRLRRIKQLGLTSFVYPGANHSRFQHSIGALHLHNLAIDILRSKGNVISDEEAEASAIAILLHDIGHGPFSHALEHSIIPDISHEILSELFMQELNAKYDHKLDMAIDIFKNNYPKKFLHQLVSSQLDMDRLDYLRRDSFFTGVTEGAIGSDRIIKMLNVVDDHLVVDVKGIYSIEKFLVARRLMYWQVYLHKTVIAAEWLLIQIFRRARALAEHNQEIFATPSLRYFLYQRINPERLKSDFLYRNKAISNFSDLDDNDIMVAIKEWMKSDDRVLSQLCYNFINRKLFKIEVQNSNFDPNQIKQLQLSAQKHYELKNLDDAGFFVFSESISNHAYTNFDDRIQILFKDGKLQDIAEASDMLNISVLSKVVKKYFLCYPKEIKV